MTLFFCAGEFIVQPPFDGSFTSREGKQSYIIREHPPVLMHSDETQTDRSPLLHKGNVPLHIVSALCRLHLRQ